MATNTPVGSTISLTATGASGAAVTLTIPASAAATFHYITWVEITLFRVTVLTPGATASIVTSTNLNGNPSFDISNAAGVLGGMERVQIVPSTPIKSAVAATATTFVTPIVTGGIWRVSALWFVGP